VEKRGTFIQIVQINQLVDDRIAVEASLVEVVVAARMGMEKEAGILGS
jgi:hypothetical protein